MFYRTVFFSSENRGEIDMEKKIKHLELIQGVINRMANNSFMLKGWAVTLVAGILVLIGKDTNKLYYGISLIPAIAFWFLDSYYLLHERLYRSLYETVRQLDEEEIDFSLSAPIKEYGSDENCFLSCLISKTEFYFYTPLIAVCSLIIFT